MTPWGGWMRKSKTRLENKIEKIIGVLFKEPKWKTLFSSTFKESKGLICATSKYEAEREKK